MGKKKPYHLVYKLTFMNYKFFIYELHKFITQNQNLRTIHANLFLQHNYASSPMHFKDDTQQNKDENNNNNKHDQDIKERGLNTYL